MLVAAVCVLTLLPGSVEADCGCGSRCVNYVNELQCTRCCTFTVRRRSVDYSLVAPPPHSLHDAASAFVNADTEHDTSARDTPKPVRAVSHHNAVRAEGVNGNGLVDVVVPLARVHLLQRRQQRHAHYPTGTGEGESWRLAEERDVVQRQQRRSRTTRQRKRAQRALAELLDSLSGTSR